MATLKRTNTNDFLNLIKTDLLNWIDFEDLPSETEKDKLNSLYEEFKRVANHPYNLKRFPNETNRFADYLSGLPIAIPFYYYDIIEQSKKWHEVETLTEKQADKIQNDWFRFIASKYLRLMERNRIIG